MHDTRQDDAATEPARLDDETVAARAADAAGLLEAIEADRGLLAALDDDLRERLLIVAGRVSRPDKTARRRLAKERLRRQKQADRDDDEELFELTGIRRLRAQAVYSAPAKPELGAAYGEPSKPIGEVKLRRACYVCHEEYTGVHPFYDRMCMACGDLNYAKRFPQGDLTGRVALVTGARVKIGYQAALMLLRAGATVIVATRFPRDAAKRYAAEPDFDAWGSRLTIHGIDLRFTPAVEALCRHLLGELDRLDLIINNACQTVRRPAGFYGHLMALEMGDDDMPAHARALVGVPDAGALVEGGPRQVSSAALTQLELLDEDRDRSVALFPSGQLDADLQQVDLREVNSWRYELADVPTLELLEVQLVNAVAPFVLNARLKPLMMRVPSRDAHIVNVSAMEGQFYRHMKTARHPHTNMAKAALNMLTRTSAMDYVRDGIHMNSVDTGWVTDEDPVLHAERKKEEQRFHPPLDIVDGAARIVDPFFDGLATGEHVWGRFLKDYRPVDW